MPHIAREFLSPSHSFDTNLTHSNAEADERCDDNTLNLIPVRKVLRVLSFREAFFWFPSARPFVLRGTKIAFFFERVIFEKSWPSAAPALRFLAVPRFFGAPARPFRRP